MAGGRVVVAGLVGEARENVNLVNDFINQGVTAARQATTLIRQFGPVHQARPIQVQTIQAQPTRQISPLQEVIQTALEPVWRTAQRVADIVATFGRAAAPEPPTPQPEVRITTPRTQTRPSRRSHRLRRLTHGRMTIDLTQGDDPEDLGTEFIDLTHED